MRSDEGVFLVDGPVLLREALDAGMTLRTVYVEHLGDGGAAHDGRAGLAGSLERAEAAGAAVRTVAPGTLAKVLDLGAPQSVVAVVQQRVSTAHEVLALAARTARPVLVPVALADPGNVGTLVRTAEAAGCAGVVLVGDGVDPFNPKTVRATAGSLFRVPVAQLDGVAELVAVCRDHTVALVGTAGTSSVAPEQALLSGAVALLVGNEAHGLGPEALAVCDVVVGIPMQGRVESLNAAVAGSVLAFEAARQRRGDPTGAPSTQPNGSPPGLVGHDDDPVAAETPEGSWSPEHGSPPE